MTNKVQWPWKGGSLNTSPPSLARFLRGPNNQCPLGAPLPPSCASSLEQGYRDLVPHWGARVQVCSCPLLHLLVGYHVQQTFSNGIPRCRVPIQLLVVHMSFFHPSNVPRPACGRQGASTRASSSAKMLTGLVFADDFPGFRIHPGQPPRSRQGATFHQEAECPHRRRLDLGYHTSPTRSLFFTLAQHDTAAAPKE